MGKRKDLASKGADGESSSDSVLCCAEPDIIDC